MPIIVGDLAKKLRVQPKLILQMLQSLEIPVEGPESQIDDTVAEAVSTVIKREKAQRRAANEAKKKEKEAKAAAESATAGQPTTPSGDGRAAGAESTAAAEKPKTEPAAAEKPAADASAEKAPAAAQGAEAGAQAPARPPQGQRPAAQQTQGAARPQAQPQRPAAPNQPGQAAARPQMRIPPGYEMTSTGVLRPIPGSQQAQRPVNQQGQRPPQRQGQPPQGQQRPPQGQGQPRPQGQQGQGGRPPYQRDGQRPQGQGGAPGRPNYGARPQGQQGQGGRPPYQRDGQRPQGQGNRPPGQSGRPGGAQGRPGQGGRPGGGGGRSGGPFIPQPQQSTAAATPSSKIVKKDHKYSDERYRDQERIFSSENERQQRDRRSGRNSSRRNTRRTHAEPKINTQMPSQIELGGPVTVKGLADLLKTDGPTIIKKLMQFGMMVGINQEIDLDTATIVATELGSSVVAPKEAFNPESIVAEEEDDEANLEARPPVITVMGHVDHGKTSLLDAIRSANVVSGEAGGITQHIGAYTVEVNERTVTFLDTPGHAAFTAMRARGAQVTDIAVLVVAADDGVMPQTIEAINHAKAAGVPIIVAINKIDKPGANPDRVKQELTEYELIAEEWGGDTIMVPVSAIKGDGIQELLENIILVADMAELKANPHRRAVGTVIEAKLDRGRGPVATVLVHKGTLNVGDILVVGSTFGRVRAMVDDKGRRVKSAGPSQPVEVIGLNEVPDASDACNAVEDERAARVLAETRANQKKEVEQARSSRVTLEDLFTQMQEGQVKDLNIILKGDVHGSVEAIRLSLERLSTSEVRVNIVHTGVGAVNESDVMLATASHAIIIGFNVRPDSNAQRVAEQQKIDIRTYRIIYEILDDVEAAMKGLLAPVIREQIIAHIEVREIFRVSRIGNIAGCYVLDGKVTRSSSIRVIRDGTVIHEGKIASLRRIKDDVREVASGYECGILLERFNDVKIGDQFEAFVMEEIERTEL